MTLQMESGAALDLRCTTCDGDGEVYAGPACDCGCRGRMCGHEAAECPDCEGDGRVRCDFCGEHPASELGLANDLLCRGCAVEELAARAPCRHRLSA